MDQFERLKARLRSMVPALELRENEPMSRHTTFRIGGPVRLMALPRSEEQAAAALRAAAALQLSPFFMGNGSDLLVSDSGAEVFVLKAAEGMDHMEASDGVIQAGSGVLLSRLAQFALSHGLTGLEFAQGIPGSLGGALTMNAGAYGGEMSQVVTETRCLRLDGQAETVSGAAQDFSYRHSAFSDGRRMIVRAELRLSPGDPAQIRARMEELAQQRRAKQPLEYPSAGSTFKRPANHFAAALIDQCGLKGHRVGGAQVSEKHAGFVVNLGGATCSDVLRLMDDIRETVYRETGVALEPEVKYLG